MASITSLVKQLRTDFPALQFAAGSRFSWSPSTQTIYYVTPSADYCELLHEVAHALLGHTAYQYDIELLQIERAAWQYAAAQLAPCYDVAMDHDTVEDALDTYRDWLHRRSCCPHCEATGMQQASQMYKCLACGQRWKANDARTKALRRFRASKTA